MRRVIPPPESRDLTETLVLSFILSIAYFSVVVVRS